MGYDYQPTPRRNLLIRCREVMAPNPYLAATEPAPTLADNPYLAPPDASLAPSPYANPSSAPTAVPSGTASFPPPNE